MNTKEINLVTDRCAGSINNTENPLIKVAAYIRVSTDTADQENSYETQERYFNTLLASNCKWVSAGIYSDYGISGTTDKGRTGFKRIMRHCREGKIDRIVCKSISRFARNTHDFLTALDTLKNNNISILFEKENIDTANTADNFILTALGAFAQEESRSISENIRQSIKQRYSCGIAANRHIYGYRCSDGGKIEIIEDEAKIIRRIFEEIAEGKAYIEVARELNKENIPPPEHIYTKKHKNLRLNIPPSKGELKYDIDRGWTAQNISNIIKLERYTGDVLLNKSYIKSYITHKSASNSGEMPQYLIKNHHPAIIEHSLFDKVQNIRKINSQKYSAVGAPGTYPLSKLIVCSCCGRFYTVRKYKDKTFWFCPTSALNNGRKVCNSQPINEDTILNICTEAFKQRFIGSEMFQDLYGAERLLRRIAYKLESSLKTDNIERDCYFLTQNNKQKYGALIERMKNYGDELEGNLDNIKRAIEWIKTLPYNNDGINKLIAGFGSEYLKSFVFSLTVYEKGIYRFCWFDGKETTIATA